MMLAANAGECTRVCVELFRVGRDTDKEHERAAEQLVNC